MITCDCDCDVTVMIDIGLNQPPIFLQCYSVNGISTYYKAMLAYFPYLAFVYASTQWISVNGVVCFTGLLMACPVAPSVVDWRRGCTYVYASDCVHISAMHYWGTLDYDCWYHCTKRMRKQQLDMTFQLWKVFISYNHEMRLLCNLTHKDNVIQFSYLQ